MREADLYVRVRKCRDMVHVMLRNNYETYEDRLKLEAINEALTEVIDALDRKEVRI